MLELSAAEKRLRSAHEVPYGLAADPLASVCGLHLPFRETLPLCRRGDSEIERRWGMS